ncbi:hypothetical protein EJ05DRAFT_503843 [Pseudovirgaria hyperparasitica]|uniref:Uncharacterized protein n=1 Tax=Pseudovirgaria hyperparasitica TaxID=470096 RepID=A0A6A6VYY4_9PEZI|nr:uncharacterized protein EJ05DRAFT_503843 [Pseudovirgaria hyperparasitica]KAF2754900.1 hypothetical protein EJ05DRAFT_503843 [Pseudovirgaria hyperparasitica]
MSKPIVSLASLSPDFSTTPMTSQHASEPAPYWPSPSTSSVHALTAQPSIPSHNRKDVFPLMELPAELRILIYRMCLKRNHPIHLHMPLPEPPPPDREISVFDSEGEEEPTWAQPALRTHMRVTRSQRTQVHVTNPRLTAERPSTCGRDRDDNLNCDPLVTAILRISKQVHHEARPVLYGDNEFVVGLDSALHTLSRLHQRSRSLIKVLIISINSHHDILEGFADLIRMGMRYCWGLEILRLKLTTAFPEMDHTVALSGPSCVYANAFHILRWLPKPCKVRLEGRVPEVIERIVRENERSAETLDEHAYQKRQHQMPEKGTVTNSYTPSENGI